MPFVVRSDGLRIYYDVYGNGPALFCGPPFSATASITDETEQGLTSKFVEELGKDYRLLLVDYPYGRGHSGTAMPEVMSVDRVAADFLAVADKAGMDRFAFFGYSWGAVTGLQLALRTQRLTALIAAGFPPVGAPYDLLLDACRHLVENPAPRVSPEFMQQFVRYYEDLQKYDDEAALARIKIPCMTFVGDRDVVDVGSGPVPIYANVSRNHALLERSGWQVEILEGDDHHSALQSGRAIPAIRAFLMSSC